MNLNVLIPIVASVAYGVLLFIVIRQHSGNKVNRAFALYLLVMTIWSLGSFMLHANSFLNPLFWLMVNSYSSMAMPLVFFYFIQLFLGIEKQRRAWLYSGLGSYVALSIITGMGYVVREGYVSEGVVHFEYGPGVVLLALHWYFLIGMSIFDLVRQHRATKDEFYRNRIKYLLLGIGVVVLGTFTNFTPLGKYPVDITANLITAFLIAYVIYRYQLLDITLLIRKGLAYSALTAGIAATYLLTIFLFERLARTVLGYGAYLIPVLVAVVVAVLLRPLGGRAQTRVDRLFFREQYDAQQMLHRLSRTVTSILDLDVLSGMLLEEVTATMHIAGVCILLKEQKTGEFYLAAQRGLGQDVTDLRLRRNHLLPRWMARERQVLTAHEMDILPQFKAFWGEEKESLERLGAELFVPLLVKGGLVGLFAFGPKLSEEAYSQDEKTILTTLANQAAIAIENARLYQAERKRAAQLAVVNQVARQAASILDQDQLLQEVVTAIQQGFNYYNVVILLLDEAASELEMRAIAGGFKDIAASGYRQAVGVGMVGWTAETGQPLLANDVSQEPRYIPGFLKEVLTRSELCVPLKLAGQVIGVLDVQDTQLNTFDETDLPAMETLADQMAVVIENARLFGEAKRRFEETTALYRTSLDITARLGMSELLKSIVERAVTLLQAEVGGIYLYDPERGHLRWAVSYGCTEKYVGVTLKPGEGMAGRVFQSGEPLIVDDYRTWEGRASVYEADQLFTAVLQVPLKWQDRIIGVLSIGADAQQRTFNQDDLWLATLFANQAAIAIENARIYEAERKRATQLELIGGITQKMASILNLDELLNQVIHLIQNAFSYYRTAVLLVEADSDELVLRAVSSPFEAQIGRLRLKIGREGITGWVAHSGEPLLVNDVSREPRYYLVEESKDTRSELAVPIKLKGEAIGVLDVESVELDAFSQDDISILQTLADQLAIAIENARLFEETQRRAEQMAALRQMNIALTSTLEQEQVLGMILDQLKTILDYDSASIQTLSGPYTVHVAAARPPSHDEEMREGFDASQNPLFYEMKNERKAVVIDDVRLDDRWVKMGDWEQVRSWAGVPLYARDNFLGFLNVEKGVPGFYKETHVQLLRDFAQGAALAIENARLFEAEAQRRQEAETLRQAAMALTSTLDLEEALDRILEQLYRVVAYDSASVQLLRGDYLEIVGGRGFADPSAVIGLRFPIPGDNPNTRVIESGQPIILADAQAAHAPFREPPHSHIRSWLGVPVGFRGQIIGLIALDSTELGHFTADHARLAAAFANQAAVAIENARLFEETRRRMEQTQVLLRVSEATASALDSTEVMRRIALEAAQALGADMTGAYLLDETGKNLRPVAGYHVPPEWLETYQEFRIPAEGHPFVEEAWMSQRTIFTNDAANDSRFDEETYRLFHARSVLLTPMIVKGVIIGGLWAVWWEEVHHFTEEEQQLVGGIVRQAAIAFENARLYEQVTALAADLEVRVQERTAELARKAGELFSLYQASVALSSSLEVEEILKALAQQAALALDAVDCTICELQDDALVVVTSYWNPALPWENPEIGRRYLLADYPATREALEKGQPLRVRVDDPLAHEAERAELQELGYTTLLQVHIVSRDRVMGVVEAFDNKPEREFSEDDAALLQTISNQAGMAIERAHLFQQAREERNHLELLYEASREMSASLDLEQTLHDIFRVSVAATGASRGSIFVFDEEGRVAHRILMRDLTPAEAEDTIDRVLRQGLAGWVLEHKQPAIAFDTSRDERWLPFPDDPEPTGSAMAIPFIERDRVRGLLTLVHPQPYHFNQTHLELLSSIANQIAVVIERAQLHERARRRAVQLATAAEVSRDATSTLDVGQLLTRTVDLIRDRFDLYYAGIFLVDEAGEYAVLQAGAGEVGQQMLKQGHKLQVGGTSMVGQCVANAQACIALDVGGEASHFDNPLLPETRSEMALPLVSRGRVIGAMTIQSDRPAAFSEEDVTVLQTLADQLANAIENARLYGETCGWAQDAARQKEQTDAIVQSMADGLIVTDLESRLVLANPAAEELLEFRLEDAIGQEIGANIRDDRLCQTVRDTLDRQQPDYEVDIELTVSHDGSRRVMRAHTAVVNDPSGQPAGIVTTLRDVTHEREVQRLKDELVSTVSHELRTPMTSVLGFSELLLTRQLSEEKRHLYAQTIHKEAQRLSALINDFLDVQRMERGQQEYHFEEVDLGEIAHEMVATCSGQSEAHTLTLDLPPDLPLVQADSDRLRQVFGNLLSNAIKFSPGGGTVAVSVQAEGGEIHAAVSDEGIGIPAEALPHLFERFFRVDSSDRREIGGTGLGLAICREIVEAHGGRIWAESPSTLRQSSGQALPFDSAQDKLRTGQVGPGTTVTFSLPIVTMKRILVIDDEQDIRQMFQVLLSGKNYEVRTAANGWEGLSLMEAERPDLVILDIAMPVMNGYQFLEKVRGDRRTKDIPVIAISGADTDLDRLKELGMDEFLSKPFSGTVLLATVRRLLPRP